MSAADNEQSGMSPGAKRLAIGLLIPLGLVGMGIAFGLVAGRGAEEPTKVAADDATAPPEITAADSTVSSSADPVEAPLASGGVSIGEDLTGFQGPPAALGGSEPRAVRSSAGWLPATELLTGPLVNLKIEKVRVGRTELRQLNGSIRSSDEPYLLVYISIANSREVGAPVKYVTWRQNARAADEVYNILAPIKIPPGSLPAGGVDILAEIPPGGKVSDVLVFEPPREGCQALYLWLPNQNVGRQAGVTQIEIPFEMIDRS